MQLRIALAAWLPLFCSVLRSAPEPEARTFALTELDAARPGAGRSEAGLSDTGWVVGVQADRDGAQAFAREPRTGALERVAPPSAATSSAVDVNASGTVVGCFSDDPGSPFLTRGFRYRDGVVAELLSPLGERAFPCALNDAGWIAGYAASQAPCTPGALLWDPELTPRFIADLTRAVDVNARNQVVGYREDAHGIARAFLWEAGELVALGSLDPRGEGAVIPRALDGAGRVVGTSRVRGRERAFVWTRAEGMRELAVPRVLGPGAGAIALDLNDSGWIVGQGAGPAGSSALLWDPEGCVHELGTLVPGLDARTRASLRPLRLDARGRVLASLSAAGGARLVLLAPLPVRTSAPLGMLR
jgi:probable HAF family extracellular repeat protein